MQEVDDKKLSDLSKRFLQAISYCGLSGYKLKKDNIISSESTLTSIKKGIQLPSKKTIDAFCEKYDVSRAWLYTGEGLFAKTPSGQIEPSEKDIRDALKNARMQSDSTISKVAPYLQDILVKVKYVPMDAAASFVESLYNTAYEIDSYGVMPEEEAYCELSNRYIYNSIRNGKGAIGTDIIARIVDKFPELNVKWLCTGKGNMIETDMDANVNYKAAYEGAMMQIEALHKIIEENKRR